MHNNRTQILVQTHLNCSSSLKKVPKGYGKDSQPILWHTEFWVENFMMMTLLDDNESGTGICSCTSLGKPDSSATVGTT